MVDNRSAGFYGIGGGFNFKSGDISGTAAKTSDDKMGQGTEYFAQGQQEEEQNNFANRYVDRSAQINATLNSLAMANVANILKNIKRSKRLEELLNSVTGEEEPYVNGNVYESFSEEEEASE